MSAPLPDRRADDGRYTRIMRLLEDHESVRRSTLSGVLLFMEGMAHEGHGPEAILRTLVDSLRERLQ